MGDLIEMADAFEIGGEESDGQEEERGRQGSVVRDLSSGTTVGRGSSFAVAAGMERMRERGRSGTSAGPKKGGKDD